MHPELTAAQETLGVDLANLETAARFSKQARNDASRELDDQLGEYANSHHGLEVLAFGSIARDEAGRASDFDYLIISREAGLSSPIVTRRFREAVERARLQVNMGKPGLSGLFGRVVPAQHLVEQIGLEEDTNLNQSRRLLVLAESVSLRPRWGGREPLVKTILERYLLDYKHVDGDYQVRVPRFLLNDICRYWYTVAVDYQAKRWAELDIPEDDATALKWGLRYTKLRTSRKWTFAGNVVSLLMPVLSNQPATPDFLARQFDMPALARLAQLQRYCPESEMLQHLRDVLRLADRFVGWFADPEWRANVNEVRDPRAEVGTGNSAWDEAYEATRQFQEALAGLLLSDQELGRGTPMAMRSLTGRYLLL